MLPEKIEHKLQINSEQQITSSQIQAAVFMAKQCPRDVNLSEHRILDNCKRKGMAEIALYSYKRASSTISGASIRLAEMMAQNYGNIHYGTRELEKTEDYTKVETWAWDVETNFKTNRIFTVKHERDTKDGAKNLTNNRDIYEQVASTSARRLRACILEIIPADIVENAINTCKNTIKSEISESHQEQVKRILNSFLSLSVNKSMIEKYLNHSIDLVNADEILELRGIYNSLKDGSKKREDYFEFEETKTSKINSKLAEIAEVIDDK